jgi:hypothetical protein
LNLIDLLFDSHLSEPEALVDAPLLEDLLHLLLALLLRGSITLGALARLSQDYHLVNIFLTLYYVLVCAGDGGDGLVDVFLGLRVVEKEVESHEALVGSHFLKE